MRRQSENYTGEEKGRILRRHLLGAAMAAKNRRVILFIGDGSFQLTCQALSTMIRNGLTPKIFLINNQGYTMERLTHDGSYNEVQPWKNFARPVIFVGAEGMEVRTEGDLERAFEKIETVSPLSFTEIHLGKWEHCQSLQGDAPSTECGTGE